MYAVPTSKDILPSTGFGMGRMNYPFLGTK